MAHFINRDADKEITKVEILDYCQMLTDAELVGVSRYVLPDYGDINSHLLKVVSDVIAHCFHGCNSEDEKLAQATTESDIRYLAERGLFKIANNNVTCDFSA